MWYNVNIIIKVKLVVKSIIYYVLFCLYSVYDVLKDKNNGCILSKL